MNIYFLQLYFIIISRNSYTSFISFGDWGINNNNQLNVANKIYNYSKIFNTSFNIVLGDNFYFNGVNSTNDSQWRTTYENVYKNTYPHVPWFVLLGNHDYYGNYSAEIDFTGKDNRWNMPSNNFVIPIHSGMKIIMIDTQLLDPKCSLVSKSLTNNDIKHKIYKWLINELQSDEKVKIVAGHAGIYNVGDHPNCNELIKNLFPILKINGVKIYLHGHNHLLQHNHKDGIDMIGCGSAALTTTYSKEKFKSKYLKFYSLQYGFCHHLLLENKITTQFINSNGSVIYETTTDYNTTHNIIIYIELFLATLLILVSLCTILVICNRLKTSLRYQCNTKDTQKISLIQNDFRSPANVVIKIK